MVRADGRPDASYEAEWKTFKRWVEANDLPHPPYLQRENVDRYFEEEVEVNRRKITKGTADRIVNALQYYSNTLEHTGEGNEFVVKGGPRSRVAQALFRRDIGHVAHMREGNYDAHANLPTNVLTQEAHNRCISYAFSNNVGRWMEFALTWNIDYATFLRVDSMRKMRFTDLLVDEAHGPPGVTGPNSALLGFILQPYVHKDQTVVNPANRARNRRPASADRINRANKKRVVGMYRHKNPLQCGTSVMAISLFMRLHWNLNISFERPANPNHRPTWQSEMVLENWSGENNRTSVEDTYHAVMDGANAGNYNHLTHLRSAGIERASSLGLSDREIITLSKHALDRMSESYSTELSYPAMSVMAGFYRGENWFCPRAEVEPPAPVEVYVRQVFPLYDTWVAQQRGHRGDKHAAASNFLYKLLPFIARVLIQDAPYWLRAFPNHEFSRFFRDRMPAEYGPNWRAAAIAAAEQVEENRDVAQIDNLNMAAR